VVTTQVADKVINVVQMERVQKIVISILIVMTMEFVILVRAAHVQIVMANKTDA